MLANLQDQSPYAIGWGTLALVNAGLAQSKNRRDKGSGLNGTAVVNSFVGKGFRFYRVTLAVLIEAVA